MKKILVTGAAGFVGWKTCEKLLSYGYKVTGIDNLNDYYDINLKNYRLEKLEDENFSFHLIDIENYNDLDDLFKKEKYDAVINLAARAGVRYSIENPDIYFSTNLNGTLNLLKLLVKYDIKKFVLASTSSLYAGQPLPYNEELAVNTPISPYAASKKAAEAISYTYHYLFDIDVTILRYFTVYGPAGRPDMAPLRFVNWIMNEKEITLYGDGSQSRDFTYVDDIAEGTIKGLRPLGFEVINLGGGKNPVSINEFIMLIEKLAGKKGKVKYLPFNKADMKTTWADISKADKLLGWKPEISLQTGVEKTVEWFKENRDFAGRLEY